MSKGYELARSRPYSFEKHNEFYKCFSHTFLMSTNNQNDFSITVEGYVKNMLYFNSCI